jgi:hypothetical protein
MPDKIITGANCNTIENLALGRGVFFKNYDVDSDTPAIALASGKCIGATRGGGTFTATPTTRNVDIDGMSGVVDFDDWSVTMLANVIELKADTIKDALGTGEILKVDEYYRIRARNQILPSDYISNVTFIGYRKADSLPFIIQIFNAISTTGLSLTLVPDDEIVTAITWTSSTDLCIDPTAGEYAPFSIYIPVKTPKAMVNDIFDDMNYVTGLGLAGATINLEGGTISGTLTEVVDGSGEFSFDIPLQVTGTVLTFTQIVDGIASAPLEVIVKHMNH